MTTFLDALRANTNTAYTENGALTNRSSLDPVVDFFSLAGAMRNSPAAAVDLFGQALARDPLTAVRTLFYLRDVRGGQGERDVFRAGLAYLRENFPTNYARVLEHVPHYGRWDDILHDGIANDEAALELIKKQLLFDTAALPQGGPVSLLAKWLPSENTSSPKTRRLARSLREALGMTPREYRKMLSSLRGYIHLLEQDMSSDNWNGIDYGKLPSQAHRKHVKAFRRHTPERYAAYLESVNRGEAKINVSTVYPYEIYNMVTYNMVFTNYANTAWENLPDYTQGSDALVMADVSGSMVRPFQPNNPIAVSVSLALYFAERNKGAFKGFFMTFSEEPRLVAVRGRNLQERIRNIQNAGWGMNTDLSRAFRAILAAAVQANEPPPRVLYIISDMEFDQATPENQATVFQTAKQEFQAAGYELPHVVFWNVNARNVQTPATVLDGQVTLVSGLSPTVFAMAVEGKSPRQLVDSVVHSERYERITL